MIRKIKTDRNYFEHDSNHRLLVFKEKAILHSTTTTNIRLSSPIKIIIVYK